MNATAKLVGMLVVAGGLLGGCTQKEASTAQHSSQLPSSAVPGPARVEWKLPSPLGDGQWAIDVSWDRKLAVFWNGSAEDPANSVWLVNLETGQGEDILAKIRQQNGTKLSPPRQVLFSPDGKHIAARFPKNVEIIDPFTGKTVFTNAAAGYVEGIAWLGNQFLLLNTYDRVHETFDPISVHDLAGKRVGELKIRGRLLGSDSSGKKLLVARMNKNDPTTQPTSWENEHAAVVTPEGKILREVAGTVRFCHQGIPVISRQGNYAGAYVCYNHPGEKGPCRRIDRVDAEETIIIPGTWGQLAISESGGCLSMTDDDLCFWTRDGKNQVVAEHAMAGTILGDEIFFIQGDSKSATLRAVPIPQSGPGIASLARPTELLAQERAAATQPSPTTSPIAPKK